MGNFRDNRNSSGGRNFGPRRDFGDRPRPMMHKAICASCGKDCEVPFRPTGERPVYCSDCFEKQGGGAQRQSYGRDRGQRPPFRRPEENRTQPQPQNRQEFEAINAKLDKILKLLTPAQAAETVVELPSEPKAEEAPKKKRVSKKKAETPTEEAPIEEVVEV